MTQEHPITPPPELVQQWIETTRSHDCIGAYPSDLDQQLATQAARWGADQELDACCDWVYKLFQRGLEWSKDLRAARRPGPTLKQQALEGLRSIECNFPQSQRAFEESCELIRRAIESLPD